jgi:uncharacterized SAM-binding protein YcdF (DUF218 family)
VLALVAAACATGCLVLLLLKLSIHIDSPKRADAIVLLGSDNKGRGEMHAASLHKAGWAGQLLVADQTVAWNVTSGELWTQHLLELGVPRSRIHRVHVPTDLPWQALDAIGAELSRRGWRRVIVVTHSWDSGRIRFIALRTLGRRGIECIFCPFSPSTDLSRHAKTRERTVSIIEFVIDLFWRR